MLNLKKSLLILLVLNTFSARADNLSTYRDSDSSSVAAQEKVKAQSEELLKLLGDSAPDVSFIANPSASIKGRKRVQYSSSLIKMQMDRGIRALIQKERYGRPMTFTPSSTTYTSEALEEKRNFRLQVCRDTFTKDSEGKLIKELKDQPFEQILNEFHALSKERSSNEASSFVAVTPEIRKLINQSSVNDTAHSPEALLGSLTDLEIEENSIYALRFSKGDKKTNITLSMLVTYLSDEDEAYLAMLDCVLDESMSRLEDANKKIKRYNELTTSSERVKNFFSSERTREIQNIDIGLQKYNQTYYSELVGFLKPRFDSALEIHRAFDALSQGARRDLLAVLLRAQQKEIPSGEEIEALSAKTGSKINQLIESQHDAQAKQISIDMNYFSQIQKQLSRLKDALIQKNTAQKQTEEIIRTEIKGGH